MKYYIGKVPFGKDDNDSLTHYGRKGMKWGKNIFEDEPNQVFKAAGRAAKNVAGGAARAVGNAFNTVKNTAKGAGKAIGNYVDNRITGNSNRNLARQYQKEADSAKKDATVNQMRANAIKWLTKDINYSFMPDNMARKVMDTISKAQYDAQNRSWEAGDKARAAQENANAYKKLSDNALANRAGRLVNNVGKAVGGAAKQVYDKTDQLGNRIGINNFGKLMYDPVYAAKQAGKAVGNVANDVGNAVGSAANAAGNWVGDRARDVDRFVNTSITGKNFHDQADRLRSSGNQDAINVANQLDEIGNRSLLGRAGNLVNNIGNAVGGVGQWAGERVNDANRFINTSITGKNFYDQANQIRANSNNPEAAAVADQLDEIGNRSLFGRIGNAVGQAGQWIGDRANDVGNAVGGAANAVGGWAGDRVRDINDLAGQAGQWLGERANDVGNTVGGAVGNVRDSVGGLVRDRADDVGDFVDRYVTGNSAREKAEQERENAELERRKAAIYDKTVKGYYNSGNPWVSEGIESWDQFKDRQDKQSAYMNNARRNASNSDFNAREADARAYSYQNEADNSLFGRAGNLANNIGNAVGQAGQAVGQTMSNIGDWGGEQLDRGKRILGRLFGGR